MKSVAAKRLEERAKHNDPDGEAFHNLSKILLNKGVVEDILTCLKSSEYLDLSDGLYFTMGLLKKYKLKDFGEFFCEYFIDRIPELITKKQNSQVRMYALEFYVWLKDNYPNYRDTMLHFLSSDDLTQRRFALNNYESYCKLKEIGPLLNFRNDKYIAELAMCGPLEYQFRNIALEKISKIIGKNFLINKVKEQSPDWGNDYVSWFDWKPFLDWYNKK